MMNSVKPAPRRPLFYVELACFYGLITAVGFSRRYFLPLIDGSFSAPAIVHVHGTFTFVWIAFVLLQSLLVVAGRVSLHRTLGAAGIALAALLVFTALELVILQLAKGLTDGAPAPREFAALMLSTLSLIAVLLVCGIGKVTQPETHKRLMTMATLVILTPALARCIQMAEPSWTRLLRNDVAGYVSDALILAVIVLDTLRHRKPHRAYLLGLAGILTVQLATLLLRSTPAWYRIADALARLPS